MQIDVAAGSLIERRASGLVKRRLEFELKETSLNEF